MVQDRQQAAGSSSSSGRAAAAAAAGVHKAKSSARMACRKEGPGRRNKEEEILSCNTLGPAIKNQCRYSVGDAATSAAAIAYCNEHGITFLAYLPLHSYVPEPAPQTVLYARHTACLTRWVGTCTLVVPPLG